MWTNLSALIVALGILLIGFQNCSKMEFTTADLSRVIPFNEAVCDPFSSGEEAVGLSADNGLVGELRYLVMGEHGHTSSELNSHHLDYYLSNGFVSDNTYIFSQLATPTLSFTSGFKNGSGEVLQNPSTGEDLIEYFALSFESQLKLGPEQEAGWYQLALMSDDGSVLRIPIDDGDPNDPQGTYEVLIDNDGTHSTRLKCAADAVYLEQGDALPIEVHYFQGPRTDIALQLMWRRINSPSETYDDLCGKTGRYSFFHGYDNGGVPQPTDDYQDLLANGWAPIEPENYLLPSSVANNPCVLD